MPQVPTVSHLPIRVLTHGSTYPWLDLRMAISPLEAGRGLGKVWGVTTAVANAIAKMTKRQKLALADRLLAEAGTHTKPSSVYGSDDPALAAELRRRLDDRSPGAWLSLEEFRARTRPR